MPGSFSILFYRLTHVVPHSEITSCLWLKFFHWVYTIVFVISVIKYHDHKQLGEQRVYFTYTSTPVHPWKKSGQELKQCRTWRQELMQGPQKRATYWLPPPALLGLFSYTHQGHLLLTVLVLLTLPKIGWALPHQSWVKTISCSLAYRSILWKNFSPIRFLLPRWPYLVSRWHKASKNTLVAIFSSAEGQSG